MAVIHSLSQPFNSVEFGRVIADLYQGERSFDSALRAKSGAAKHKESTVFYYRTELYNLEIVSPGVDLHCKFLNI